MTFTLTGCNQQVEKASSKQSVTLSLEQTSSQDVDVYLLIGSFIISLTSTKYQIPSLEVITIFFRTTFKPFLSICRFYRLFLYF